MVDPSSKVEQSHLLDNPIWSALTGRQKMLAEGGELARRYPTQMVPFAGLANTSAESFADLRSLMAPADRAVLFTTDKVTPPSAFEIFLAKTGEQMIGAPANIPPGTARIVTLGAEDVPAMMELAELTKPGPFLVRTHEMGRFLGIWMDGQLAAMAGERMRPGDYTEITAVCTHPSHRGRGYAQILLGAVSRQIQERGELPFLHVFSDNEAAIALYRRLGMRIRRRMHVTVLGLQAAP